MSAIYDPWANSEEVKHEYGLKTVQNLPDETFDTIVLNVAHNEFLDLNLENFLNSKGLIYDVKGILKKSDGRL